MKKGKIEKLEKKPKKQNTVSLVKELSDPIAEKLGLSIWDVSFYKEGPDWNLKVTIDSEKGISFDDCEAFSRALDKILDELDPIEQSYCLEVSSAGLGRKLTEESHFKRFYGEKVKVRLIRPEDGEKELSGILKEFSDKTIFLEIDGGTKGIPFDRTAFVKVCDDEDLF